jgi:hypothetical protein
VTLVRVYYAFVKTLLHLVLSVLALVAPVANSCKCAVGVEPLGHSDAHVSCAHSCHGHGHDDAAETESQPPAPDECPRDWRCGRHSIIIVEILPGNIVEAPTFYATEWYCAGLRCNSGLSCDSQRQQELHPPPRSPAYLRFGRMLI